ncbi:MAG TPA: adenylate kinase [Bacillota bacterium]
MSDLCLIFLGPPGVGKGTQAVLLSERRGIPHISTGDMFRRAIRERTPMGERARPYVESGGYVPDEIVNGIVAERLSEPDCAAGFILDGFPRTIGQAEALDGILAAQHRGLHAAVCVEVPDPVILRRLTGRRQCARCGAVYHVEFDPPSKDGICDRCGGPLVQRDDDNDATVRRRLQVYHEQTAPLVEHYTGRGLLVRIDGDAPVDEVSRRIDQALAAVGRS